MRGGKHDERWGDGLIRVLIDLQIVRAPFSRFVLFPTFYLYTLGWIVLNGKKERGGKKRIERKRERRRSERERERDEESMRERDRWGSEWVRERGRLLKREREREWDRVWVREKEWKTRRVRE